MKKHRGMFWDGSCAARVATVILFVAFGSCAVFGQKTLPIAAVQGTKDESPYTGESVTVSGIVTARTRTGFFIQTPDGSQDADSASSEGIFVFTKNRPPEEAAIGNEVSVEGRVDEYRPKADPTGLSITEISHFVGRDTLKVLGKGRPLPNPVLLTVKNFNSNTIDELERFEGMRVAIGDALTVGPSGGRLDEKAETVRSDGVFYAVLKGVPRPFREPGIDIRTLSRKEVAKWREQIPRLPVFDSNPEVMRIDTGEQEGSRPLNVTAKVDVKNISGVLHFAFGKYAILTDPTPGPSVSTGIRPVPMPEAKPGQFVIASSNIESFFDDVKGPGSNQLVVSPEAFEKRLSKISLAVRDLLKLPDILATVEIEGSEALNKLAERINKDTVADGKPDPKYKAVIFEGNDQRGIDNGFLVKTSTVEIVSAKQLGKDEKYKDPVTGDDDFLNDRTPLVLDVAVRDARSGTTFPVTVVVNHLKSYRGVDDPEEGPNVRLKKKLQAEFLAKWVNAAQKADPKRRILLVGDFNAFQFNDGLVDVVGTVTGRPAPKDAVVLASDDLVDQDLTDLVNLIAADQQYSFVFDGNAQALDHFIVNDELKKHVAGFGFLRVNADFPQAMRGDASRAERFSDHDVAVGYFNFDAKK